MCGVGGGGCGVCVCLRVGMVTFGGCELFLAGFAFDCVGSAFVWHFFYIWDVWDI